MNTGKKKEKSGLFNSLKKRFWSGSVTSRSYLIDKGSKLKFKSKSSHCNLTSSDSENCNGVFTGTSTLSVSEELSRVHSSNDPTVSNSEDRSTESPHVNSNLGALNISGRDIGIQTVSIDHMSSRNAEGIVRSHSRSSVTSPAHLHNTPHSSPRSVRSSLVQSYGNDIYDNIVQYEELSSSNLKSGLTSELLKLSKYGWYWGSISKEEAEEKLTDQADGAFLLRDSSADHFILSLSFRSSGKTLHTRIEYNLGRGLFSFYQQADECFASITDLIEHSMLFSKSSVYCYSRPRSPGYPAFPVRLTKPVSRFAQVRSLQHLCRFVIRESIRLDNIQKLPLPNSIKGYIEEGHY